MATGFLFRPISRMSRPSQKSITCPTCKHTFDTTLWLSVSAPLNPELRTRVLDGSMFDHSCPKCGQAIYMNHDFVYSDPKRRFMVALTVPKNGKPPSISTELLEGT